MRLFTPSCFKSVALFFVTLLVCSFSFCCVGPISESTPNFLSIFYYQDGKNAQKSFFAHPDAVDVFAPQTYSIDVKGTLQGKIKPELLTFASKHAIKVMPLVTNKMFSQTAVHTFLDDAVKQDTAINALVSEAKKHDFWGWQVDFEQMDASYRDRFSAFIKRADDVFVKNNLVLSVAVIAQTSSSPSDYPKDLWQKVIGVYDYGALASDADFLSIMSYDDPNSSGPVAGLPWVKQVLDFALQSVPKEKLSLGIPLYYWQWNTATGKRVGIGGNEGIQNVIQKYRPIKVYSNIQDAPYLTYKRKGSTYVIWYENGESLQKKIQLILDYGLHGFSAWSIGLEVPDIYKTLKKY